jgi:Core-2/I-Branching enzyme
MKIAYLILAHNNPGQLARLTQALTAANATIFIHIDKKADIRPFLKIAAGNIHFTPKRVSVHWGDFSTTEAILLLINAAMAMPERYDYLVLTSGNDYPIRTPGQMQSYFLRNPGSEFINMVMMPSKAASKSLSWLTDYRPRPGVKGKLIAQVRRVLVKSGIIARPRDYKAYFGGLTPYAGSTWWALSHDACAYIQNFVARHRRIIRFYANTTLSDEMVFQTILGNSRFKENIRRNLTYTDWSLGGPHPSDIEMRHVDRIRSEKVLTANDVYGQGELFFVRKVRDPEIVDQLDRFLRTQPDVERVTFEQ